MNILSIFRKKKSPAGMTKRWIHLDEVDSTNRYLHDLDDDGSDLTIVEADHQLAGRGQGSNTWESERGQNLLFSIRIRPTMVPVACQFMLSEMEALALLDAIQPLLRSGDSAADKRLTLKWPNDIYHDDRKLGGTLIETAVGARSLKSCIFGTGINVNQTVFTSDAPNPVSLRQIVGHELDRHALLESIVKQFEHYYGLIASSDYQDIAALYHANLYRAHGFHHFRDDGGDFEAAIVEVEDDGTLILRDREGRIRSYAFKQIEYII